MVAQVLADCRRSQFIVCKAGFQVRSGRCFSFRGSVTWSPSLKCYTSHCPPGPRTEQPGGQELGSAQCGGATPCSSLLSAPWVCVEKSDCPQGGSSLPCLQEECPWYSCNREGESPPSEYAAEACAGALNGDEWLPWAPNASHMLRFLKNETKKVNLKKTWVGKT